ncbi:MAG: hypothetical protein ACLR07_11290 [Christensenellales bacterium]
MAFSACLKPPGMTSSDVVVRVRRKLGRGAKVGHAGTLDPEASGVLPLMIEARRGCLTIWWRRKDLCRPAQAGLCHRYAGRAWGNRLRRGRAGDAGAA